MANKIGDFDMHLTIGGRFKLLENYTINLSYYPGILEPGMDDMAGAINLEFDPIDHNVFYIATSSGLYKVNRRESDTPVKMNTSSLGSPTCLNMSD